MPKGVEHQVTEWYVHTLPAHKHEAVRRLGTFARFSPEEKSPLTQNTEDGKIARLDLAIS